MATIGDGGGKTKCSQGNQKEQTTKGKTTTDDTPVSSGILAILRSSDPNEIVGTDGWIVIAEGDTTRWVGASQSMPFTIYFENDPEQATAAAQVVTIRMRLDPLMNMADFGIGTFGFGNHVFPVEGAPLQYQTRLDLTTEMNLYVDVVAGIDITTNEAFWIFSSIDPVTGVAPTETDRGFLAVNDSTHIGEGYVTFSIKPKTDLCHTGDTISAQASIVFDINDPIETNRWVNTIDAVPPVSTATVVQETTDSLSVVFSGTDDTTGIAAYRLYYTEGRSAFRLAGRYQPGDTAVLEKNPNVQYTFFSIAEDNVGNMEPMKDSPDTLFGNTRVNLLASVTPAGAAVIEGTGAYTQGDTAQLVLHPATGYRLSRWTEAGVPQGTDTLLSLITDRSHTLVAEMALQQYPLTVEAATGTTIEVTSHSQGAMTNSLSPITYADTLNIHFSSSPCYSNVAFFLNSQPISDDTTIIVRDSVHLTSTATAHIDTGYVHDTVCPGTAYIANGFNILSSATQTTGTLNFQFSIINSQNCDSIAVLSLVVSPSHTLSFLPNGGTGTMPVQHVCSGEAAVLNHSTFTREGYYFAGWAATATATTPLYADGDVASFDSDQTLYAIWSSNCVDRVASRIVTACDSYSWGDSVYTASGEYVRTKSSVVPGGCDSVYRLHLTVKHSSENLQQVYACRQYTWIDGLTYTTDTTRQLSLTNAVGCDSLITLHLALGDDVTATETIVACDTLHWHNQTFTQSTTSATATIPSIYGCDSTITIHLTLHHSNSGTETVTACENYTWHGTTYTSTTSATITTTNAAGCDSVVTLNLTINYPVHIAATDTACETYTWNGTTYTTSGTYTYSHLDSNGCTQVDTLHLIINNPVHLATTDTACETYTWNGTPYTTSGNYTFSHLDANGCTQVDTLHLTINYPVHIATTDTACETYTWNGTTYTASGTYTYIHLDANGCTQVDTLHLTINYPVHLATTDTACETYTWNGIPYTTSGNYTYSHLDANGCTQVDTLHLTINYPVHLATTDTACETYTWNGTPYTTSGNYTYSHLDANGCTQVDTLHLTVNYPVHLATTDTACETYTWNGTPYTTSGTYTYTHLDANGCTQVDTLHLTVNYPVHLATTDTACETYTWNGTPYTTSGTYTYSHLDANGCTQVDTLHLTIHYPVHVATTDTACETYTWNGTPYTASGNYTYTHFDANGCTQVDTLHLTINNPVHLATTDTACETYTWNGTPYTASGTYTYSHLDANGCTQVDTLHLTINYPVHLSTTDTACETYTWNGTPYTTSGNYTFSHLDANGCTQVDTLHLTINNPVHLATTDTACETYTWNGTPYTTSGNYTFSHLDANGCTQVDTLHLTINNPVHLATTDTACETYTWNGTPYTTSGTYTYTHLDANGCTQVDTLHLTINYPVHLATTDTACETYTWNGTPYTTSGTYTYTHLDANGCTQVDTLHLTVNYPVHLATIDTACETYTWNGTPYTASSTYTYTHFDANGCTQVDTLHLTINYPVHLSTTDTACETYTWNGTPYTTSGTYTNSHLDANGCTQVDTLHLTINNNSTSIETVTACNSYVWHGTEYFASTNTPTYTTTNAAGCDSVVTLHLTIIECSTTEITACDSYTWHGVTYTSGGTYMDGTDTLVLTLNYSTSATETVTACDSYTWHGTMFTTTGTVTDTLTNAASCDSITTLNLTINYSNTGIETVTSCNSYVWHGTEYTASTDTATYTTTNMAGCDSVTTLHLTVIECSTTTITACDSYTWHDSTYTMSGLYTDGTDTLDLTINYSTTGTTTVIAYAPYDWYGTMLTQTGTYIHTLTNAAGCDSVVTMHFRYPLYNTLWAGDTVVTYNAQPYCGLTASYTDDDNATLGTTLTYTNGTEVITSPNCPVNAGTYTVTARPTVPVDSLLGATTTLTILPATVSVSGAEAEIAKFYDGTADAIVTNNGILTGIQGNDDLTHTVTARFSSAEVGTGLTVTLSYALDGMAASNYLLDPAESVYSAEGAILAPFLPDTTALTEDTLDGVRDGILVDANGYCAGEGRIEYTLATGSPDQYRLVFSDALFTDVDWRYLDTPTGNNGIIYFDVPVGIPTGDYSVTLYFRDHNYPELVSNPVTVRFHINLPDTYMVVLFSDVIALIDTCHCITDVQWYRRAAGETVWTPIPGATGNYCYQEGGLEGWEFFVKCKYYGQETFVCPQDDLTTLVSDEATNIIAYPNPTTGQVTVRIEHMTTMNHEFTLLNMSGVIMDQGTFSGNSVTLNLSDYQRGSYMVTVDGMVVRIIRN